jgi:hypothetical protein
MGLLWDRIRAAVRESRYVFSNHADDQLRERSIAAWQVASGAEHGRLLSERPHDRPHPSAEVEQTLADGTPVKVVWAYVRPLDLAKLVTVHFFDR